MNIAKDIFVNTHDSTSHGEYNLLQDSIYNNVKEELLGPELPIKTEDNIEPDILAIDPSTLDSSLFTAINKALPYIKREFIKEEENYAPGNYDNIAADILSNSLGKDSNNSVEYKFNLNTINNVPRINLGSLKSASVPAIAKSTYTKCLISQDSNHSNYLCSNCPFTTTSIMEAVQHFVNNDAENQYQFLMTYNTDNFKFECVPCNLSISSADKAVYHWREHLPNSSFKCFLCNFYSKDDNLLKGHLVCHAQTEIEHIRDVKGGETKLFWCIKCYTNFINLKRLQKHYLRVHGGKRFACDKCAEQFYYAKDLKNHVKVVHVQSVFKCLHCNSVLKHKRDFIKHLQKHYLRVHGELFACDICGEKFYYPEDVTSHVNCVHVQSVFKCLHCNSVLKHRYNFIMHVRAHMEDFKYHTYDKSTVLQMLSKTNLHEVSNNLSKSENFSLPAIKHEIGVATSEFSATSIDSTGPYMCKYCSFTAILKKYIAQHVRKVHVDKFLICYLCNQQFANKRTLERHVISIHGSKLLQCPHCDFKSRYTKSLNTHLKYHTGKLSQLCYICGYRGADEKNMNVHISRHIGIKSWFCNLCKYRSTTQSNLSNHMITHTNEKPFLCTLCDRRYKKKEHLKYHEQTHLKTKQFICTICNYSVPSKYLLNKHMETHSNNRQRFHCEICNKEYLKRFSFEMHKLSHAQIAKPYNCTECSKNFMRVVSLQNHMKLHTGIGRMYCLECNYSSTHRANFITHVNRTCAKAKHSHESQMDCYLCGYASSHRSNFINHVINCAKVKRKGPIVKVKSKAKLKRKK